MATVRPTRRGGGQGTGWSSRTLQAIFARRPTPTPCKSLWTIIPPAALMDSEAMCPPQPPWEPEAHLSRANRLMREGGCRLLEHVQRAPTPTSLSFSLLLLPGFLY